jgi:hypothetical protein
VWYSSSNSILSGFFSEKRLRGVRYRNNFVLLLFCIRSADEWDDLVRKPKPMRRGRRARCRVEEENRNFRFENKKKVAKSKVQGRAAARCAKRILYNTQ